MNLIIREYMDDDYLKLIQLWQLVDLTRLETTDSREEVIKWKHFNPKTFLVALDGDNLVASIIGTFDGRRGYVARFGVNPAYQHKGVGKKIAHELLSRFREMGVKKILGFVSETNKNILNFYSKFGAEVKQDIIPVGLNIDDYFSKNPFKL